MKSQTAAEKTARLIASRAGLEWPKPSRTPISKADWDKLQYNKKAGTRVMQVLADREAEGGELTDEEAAAFDLAEAMVKASQEEMDIRDQRGDRRPRLSVGEAMLLGDLAKSSQPAARRVPSHGHDGLQLLGPGESVAAAEGVSSYGDFGVGDMVRSMLGVSGAPDIGAVTQQMGSGPAGGYATPTYLGARVIDLARAKSRCIEAGVTTVPLRSATSFAALDSDPVATWRGESQEIPQSGITLSSRNFNPRTLACLIKCSVELLEDSPNFNQLVESSLATALGVQLDAALLTGNGVGMPLGVLECTGGGGINRISMGENGAPLTDYSPFSLAVQRVAEHNYEAGAFILSPRTAGELDRLVDEDGNPMKPPRSVVERRLLDTTSIPNDREHGSSDNTTVVLTGEWRHLWLGVRTELIIEASRERGFKNLEVWIRAYLRADACPVLPRAFCAIEGIKPAS